MLAAVRTSSYAAALWHATTARSAIASSTCRSSAPTARSSAKPTVSTPHSSPPSRSGTAATVRSPGSGGSEGSYSGARLDRGDRGGQDAARDARAGHEAVAEPLGGHPVPGGGEPGPVLVDEVEAGHAARHGGVGLPRERVEHLLERVRDVERMGGAGERLVAPVLGGPPALRVEPREAERGLVGERLGEHDRLRGPFAGQRERRDMVDVAAEGDRHEQAAAVLARAGRWPTTSAASGADGSSSTAAPGGERPASAR